MAAPASKTIADLSGKWQMNKTYSDPVDPALSLQGIGWLTRKAIGAATVTLHATHYTDDEGKVHVDIDQTVTGGLKGTSEKRCLDNEFRDHKDWMFGHVKGQSKYIAAEEVSDEFLKKGWLEGEEEKKGPNGESHILSYVESYDAGWTARQIWGFQTVEGERRYCRNIVVTKGAEKVEMRLVYDYLP
jgi:hypothetical protein